MSEVNYFQKLLKTLEEKTKSTDDMPDFSDINFSEVYNKFTKLPEKDMVEVARDLYIYDTKFRDLLDSDNATKKRIADYRGVKIEGLND